MVAVGSAVGAKVERGFTQPSKSSLSPEVKTDVYAKVFFFPPTIWLLAPITRMANTTPLVVGGFPSSLLYMKEERAFSIPVKSSKRLDGSFVEWAAADLSASPFDCLVNWIDRNNAIRWTPLYAPHSISLELSS